MQTPGFLLLLILRMASAANLSQTMPVTPLVVIENPLLQGIQDKESVDSIWDQALHRYGELKTECLFLQEDLNTINFELTEVWKEYDRIKKQIEKYTDDLRFFIGVNAACLSTYQEECQRNLDAAIEDLNIIKSEIQKLTHHRDEQMVNLRKTKGDVARQRNQIRAMNRLRYSTMKLTKRCKRRLEDEEEIDCGLWTRHRKKNLKVGS